MLRSLVGSEMCIRDRAKEVAAHISGDPVLSGIDLIYSSPLQRAHTTASTIQAALSAANKTAVPLTVLDDLIERDFGVLSGRPYSDIVPLSGGDTLQSDKVNYFLSAEGSETFPECLARAERTILHLLSEHGVEEGTTPKKVLLVCHGDIGKMLLAVRKGWTWKEALLSPYIANTAVLPLQW
eukprot:TRINITY_DN60294_c0_g1_i1.p1 TRINITY_DN60294_c0_g1~~TRINITY_DN60294_c0_g1_i1.p1  ORF type:complete len:182 (-),score=54.92 TRINITY_DN60294_c0_g1_i1:252-797(-)